MSAAVQEVTSSDQTKITTNISLNKELKKSLNLKDLKLEDKQSRMEILQVISDRTGLKRIEVEAVFDELYHLMQGHIGKNGSGEIILPKLGIKVKRVKRKPTKARKMISPLTGEEVFVEAKPVRDDIKLLALKPLKEILFSA